MNKSSITTIVVGVVTLAAGFVGGYFVGKKQGETKAAAFFDAKYNELRKKYESKSDEVSIATSEPVNEEPKINIVSNNPTAETTGFADTVVNLIRDNTPIDIICQQTGLSPVVVRRIAYDYTHSDVDIAEEIEDDGPTSPFEDDSVPYDPVGEDVVIRAMHMQQSPYLIDESEYINGVGSRHWLQERLYYKGDTTLVDTYGKSVDILEYIGQDAVDRLNKTEDIVYVRNDTMRKDYLVEYAVDSETVDSDTYLTPRNTGTVHRNKFQN